MVALNLQTIDNTTLTNRSLFDLNGGCGYVLKPPPDVAPIRLSVRVVSAINLPKSRDEPAGGTPGGVGSGLPAESDSAQRSANGAMRGDASKPKVSHCSLSRERRP